MASGGILINPTVQFSIIGGGDRQENPVELLWLIGGCQPFNVVTFGKSGEFFAQPAGNDLYPCTGPAQ